MLASDELVMGAVGIATETGVQGVCALGVTSTMAELFPIAFFRTSLSQ